MLFFFFSKDNFFHRARQTKDSTNRLTYPSKKEKYKQVTCVYRPDAKQGKLLNKT